MTEAEWRTTSNALLMTDHIRGRVSERKLRLVACACCRQIWDRLTDLRSRNAIETAERFADGLVATSELAAKHTDALYAAESTGVQWAFEMAASATCALDLANSISGDGGPIGFSAYRAKTARRMAQASLIRDIFGNPFRPVAFDPEWRSDTAVSLAKQMYESRDFSTMPILADALQDVGCDNDDILNHCREANATHVRGCWVVDLVLGKA